MSVVRAGTFVAFLVAFQAVRAVGGQPQPVGGNEMVLPDGTGEAVYAVLAGLPDVSVVDPPQFAGPPAPTAKKPTRKTGKES